MNDSQVIHHEGGTMFAGPDAVSLFRYRVIASAIKLYLNTGVKANRAYTPANMVACAEKLTQKKYTGTWRKKLEDALADLNTWCNNMNAALPHVEGK